MSNEILLAAAAVYLFIGASVSLFLRSKFLKKTRQLESLGVDLEGATDMMANIEGVKTLSNKQRKAISIIRMAVKNPGLVFALITLLWPLPVAVKILK